MVNPSYDTDIEQVLGAAKGSVLSLRVSAMGPDHLDFAGLIRARATGCDTPDAVVLHDNQPLVYVLDYRHAAAPDADSVLRLIQRMGMRSDAPYAAVLRPGSIEVFSLSDGHDAPQVVLTVHADAWSTVMARLIAGQTDETKTHSTHDLMLELLNAVTDHLVFVRKVPEEEALALVGRALFIRFLADRQILRKERPFPGVDHLHACFASADAAAATCAWLDETFNGDLLSLPDHGDVAYFRPFERFDEASPLSDLTAIVRGDKPVGDGAYQGSFSWGDLHFSYVPVSLLSQVYEEYVHRFDAQGAKERSVYYTPRHLAEYMVDHSFAALGPDAYRARVLDFTSGGGVFLLAAFRRLVKARWAHTGRQPATREIRAILNKQLVGMDINPAARQLSALALYLTALELDPRTDQLRDLSFDPLDGRVLIAAEQWGEAASGCIPGSLASEAVNRFGGQFDLTIGNPPWTATDNPALAKVLDDASTRAMARRGLSAISNPDNVPDLPFLWRATELTKPGGIITLALHARLLLKTTTQGHAARMQVFKGLDVIYVLNGMELRGSNVWPKIDAHFCLLFARNQLAPEDSIFHAITPVLDRGLNRTGRVRIDSRDSWSSDPSMVERYPWLFKTLAKGNALDVELIERVNAMGFPTLDRFVEERSLPYTKGYQITQSPTASVPQFLKGMRMMPTPPNASWLIVPVNTLEHFAYKHLHRERQKENYDAPLVLLRESPSTLPGRPMAMIATKNVAYSESYTGISCKRAKQPLLTALYLQAIFNSRFFLYFVLMTSSKFGCERSAFQKSDINSFPIPPIESFLQGESTNSEKMSRRVHARYAQLRTLLNELGAAALANKPTVSEIGEALVAKLYALSPADVQLVEDRLSVGLPFSQVVTAAAKATSDHDATNYGKTLSQLLTPFAAGPIDVELYPQTGSAPWRFLRVGTKGIDEPHSAHKVLAAIASADQLDCSLVEIPGTTSILIGLLNQRRYWTKTAARTLALDLIKRNHPILRSH